MKPKNPCSDIVDNTFSLLRDATKMQMGRGLDQDSDMMEKVTENAKRRFESSQREREKLKKHLEKLKEKTMLQAVEKLLDPLEDATLTDVALSGEMEKLQEQIDELNLESQVINQEDIEDAIHDLERRGLLLSNGKGVIITSKGAQFLGRGFLSRILMNLAKKGLGTHKIDEVGHGPWAASTFRPYEPGDPYDRINIERSLMAALERRGGFKDMLAHDFRIHESRHATEIQFGILVDQSASMKKEKKIDAAIETAFAVSEFMRVEFPEDKLRIYAFSEEVKQVEVWELPKVTVPQQYTDIRRALRAFRIAVAMEPGNKQVHLITDSAPNFLDGEFVGFKKAMDAVLDEVRLYRNNDIVLNLIMLDKDKELRELAKKVAQVNKGRVFFTEPENLGEAIVEDYLWSKRELLSF